MNVSLVLTVLNEARSIPGLLGSVERQTRRPDEIVICDAGSADETVALIEAWSTETAIPCRLIVSPRVNISKGRNIAIREAAGPLIAVTDGGCVLSSRWLERLCEELECDESLNLVYGSTIAQGETHFGRIYADLFNIKAQSGSTDRATRSSRAVAFRKSAWKAVGGYPEWLTLAAEDTLFFIHLEQQFVARFVPTASVEWRHGTDSLRRIYAMHRRNAFGSGEARIGVGRYAGLTTAYAVAAAVILATVRSRHLAVGLLPLAAIASRDSDKVFRHNRDARTFVLMPVVTLARDLGIVAGQTAGLLRGNSADPAILKR